jgi:hypothetical protein
MAALSLTPTTELEAVNVLLEAIGEAPVNSLVDTGLPEVTRARRFLHNASRAMQLKGWGWNTEAFLPLTRDVNNNIPLPLSTLKVDTVGEDESIAVVQRAGKLYDPVNHTFEFERDLKVELVGFLSFEDLPEAARYYITCRAARQFAASIGSQTLVQFTARDEQDAWFALLQEEAESSDFNILTGSVDVIRVLDR